MNETDVFSTLAQHGPWAIVALGELYVIRTLWVKYSAVQEARILEKAEVVKALTEHTRLVDHFAELVSRKKGI